MNSAALALWNGYNSGSPSRTAFSGVAHQLSSNLAPWIVGSGMNNVVVSTVPGYVGSNGVATFNSSWQTEMYNCAQALKWTSLPSEFFQAHPLAQPNVAQVQIGHNSTTNYSTMLANVSESFVLQGTLYSGLRRSPKPTFMDVRFFCCGPQVTQSQVAVAVAAGAASIAGGAALVSASGTTYATLGAASIGAASLFTLGVALVAVGLVIVGYYAYTYLHDSQGQGPTCCTCLPNDEPIADPN